MIKAGVGHSSNSVASEAGREAAEAALQKVGGTATFIFCFVSSIYDQQAVIQSIRAVTGEAPLAGSTDAGEITNNGPTSHGVAVMAVVGDGVSFFSGIGQTIANGAYEAGKVMAESVQKKAESAGMPLRALIMFPDVLHGNGADVVRGALSVLGQHFPIFGGAAGDDFAFKQTHQFLDDAVETDSVVGVGLAGDFIMGAGVRHGWMPVGTPMIVTRAERNVVYEIDNKPAIAVYSDIFGDMADELKTETLARISITYPLGIKISDFEEGYLIRDPLSVDEHGAITCAADIPQGSEVRLMIGSREQAIEAARLAAEHMIEPFEEAETVPALCFVFNCVAREKLFAQHAQEEIHTILDVIGRDVPFVGFYTYGEQGPLEGELVDTKKIHSRFFNETVVLFGIGEKSTPGA